MSLEIVFLPVRDADGREHKAVLDENHHLVYSCGWRDEQTISELPAREDDTAWLALMAPWVGHLSVDQLLSDNPP